MTGRPYRVAQWATGNIGGRALREVIRHPDLELVGVLVYDSDKAGVDAGVLCGEKPVGVLATPDTSAIIGLRADCVLYMPRAFALDDVVALLESGTNVVTTRGEVFGGGRQLAAPDRERIVDACRQGNSSIFATGSSPGFISDSLPLALISLARRVDSVTIDEYANLSRRNSPHLLFEQMGFGRSPDSYDGRRAAFLVGEFGPALEPLAEAAGHVIDRWESVGEAAAARATTTLAAGELAAGTVGAQRNILIGYAGDVERIRFTANWYCTEDVDAEWDLRPTGWRVRVRSDAPLDVELPFPVSLDEMGATTPGYTANRPVNAVPFVCQARPGILSVHDLPPITPAGPVPGRRLDLPGE
jgi:4-hydroxy-tetrahydrodipicolinate reductase